MSLRPIALLSSTLLASGLLVLGCASAPQPPQDVLDAMAAQNRAAATPSATAPAPSASTSAPQPAPSAR